MDFRYKRHFKATRGEHGHSKNMHGANAEDLLVKVPPGTVVMNEKTCHVIWIVFWTLVRCLFH